jgi:molybdopterin/thiamine biosynthesis adenylyltransferase
MIVNPELIPALKQHASPKHFPDHTPYLSLPIDDAERLSVEFKSRLRQIEIIALENDIVPEHYARNMRFFSMSDQIALLKAHVGIVGLGGLGGAVTEILARMGVGRLSLIDGDSFEESNLNRQFLSQRRLIGQAKADSAKQRLAAINPAVECQAYAVYLDETNAEELLADTHVIIDCLDNIKTRFILENAAKRLGAPFISAAVAGLSGQITTIYPQDPGLRQIYGSPQDGFPSQGAEAALGTLSPVVTTIAALECAEVVKILLGHGTPLRNRLLIVDLMDNTFESLEL